MSFQRPVLPLFLLLAAPALAATDLDYRGGTLGKTLMYDFAGAPGGLEILVPGLSGGPTSAPCGLGPVAVGSILLPQIAVLPLDATGLGTLSLGLPVLPVLVGLPLHAVALEFDAGAPCPFVGVSNPLRFRLLETSTAELLLGEMSVARQYHGLSVLAGDRLLLSGGTPPGGGPPTDTLERYDPRTETFDLLPFTLLTARSRHEQVTLPDGRVLIFGGVDAAGDVLGSTEVIDLGAGTVIAGAPMVSPRVEFQAVQLAGGEVLAIGGFTGAYSVDHPLGFPASVLGEPTKPADLATAIERLDPATLQWSPVNSGIQPRAGLAASLLTSGEVLITGGLVADPTSGLPQRTTDSAQLFDPQSGASQDVLPLPVPRAFHGQVATLQGGAVICAGRELIALTTGPSLSDQVPAPVAYDPSTPGAPWSQAPPDSDQALRAILICIEPRSGTGAPRYVRVSCPDDTIDGGGFPTLPLPPPLPAGPSGGDELWGLDASGAWLPLGSLIGSRPGHRAAFLPERDRAVITGSAIPPNPGLSNPDRTGEEISVL